MQHRLETIRGFDEGPTPLNQAVPSNLPNDAACRYWVFTGGVDARGCCPQATAPARKLPSHDGIAGKHVKDVFNVSTRRDTTVTVRYPRLIQERKPTASAAVCLEVFLISFLLLFGKRSQLCL